LRATRISAQANTPSASAAVNVRQHLREHATFLIERLL